MAGPGGWDLRFIGYLFLQVPAARLPFMAAEEIYRLVAGRLWAVISVLTGLVTSQYQLLVLRFLLPQRRRMLLCQLMMIGNWF